jgi:hypothetical protein
VYSPDAWRDNCRRAALEDRKGHRNSMRSGVFVFRAKLDYLEPRARSEGMATRRGVWQVAA